MMFEHPTGHIACLDSQHHSIHQILGGLDEGHGAVQTGDYQLPGDIVDISLDLACDVELVTIQRDATKICKEIRLGAGAGTLVSNFTSQTIQPLPCLATMK